MSYRRLISSACVTATLSAGLLVTPIEAESASVWQGFRNQSTAETLPDAFGLSEVWKRDLGAGYSSVAVAGDKLLVTFTSGEDDVLAGFNRADGEELWRLRLAEKYNGHSGSDDGPLASPTIDGDHVFAFGPRGQLVAARHADGEELWRVQLDDTNSNVPYYGYTASPLVVDDLVVLPAGGKGRTVTAYERGTGKLVWATGDDSVTYQSPILAELGGKRQLVMASDFEVRGLDPKTGDQLWGMRHTTGTEGQTSVHPTQIDGDHVLLNLSDNSVMLRVASEGGTWQVEEVWRKPPFGNSLVLPVAHDGSLYGFTGNILTAVDPANGKFLWRTRDARSWNLSLAGGHLAVVTQDGYLVVAQASPDGYTEVARNKVFDRGDYADPAFMDGTFYVRNQTHLAALKIDRNADNAAAPEVAPDPHRYVGTFGAFIKELEAKPEGERQAAVDAYFADVEQTPIVEAGGEVHVIHRGPEPEVTVYGAVLGGQDGSLLHKIAGTDLHYRSAKMDPKTNTTYLLGIDFSPVGPDPANPLQENVGFRVQSELRGAEFRANPYIGEPGPDVRRGTLHTFRLHSEILDNTREIQVWMPVEYDPGAGHPLLVVNYGPRALRNGGLGNTLDHLVGDSVRPVVVAFVPRTGGGEYNGAEAPDYARFLAEELVPHVERHYGTGDERAVLGAASAATVSLRTALAYPDLFDQVALQSFYLQDDDRDGFLELLNGSEAKPRVRLETGPNDYVIPDAGIDAQRSNKLVAERLEAKGVKVETHTVYGNTGWTGWRAQFDLILQDLFPLEGE